MNVVRLWVSMLIVFNICIGSVFADGYTSIDQVKVELGKSFPDSKTINIVAFGDSVPAGFANTPKTQTKYAYPRLLSDYLSDKYPTSMVNVIASGVGGENSSSGISRFKSQALAFRPLIVLIDYGLNDRLIPEGEVRSNLKKMIADARSYGALPILVTPNPDLGGDPANSYTSLDQQVALIKDVGAKEGVLVADAYSAFRNFKGDPASLMAQSNHPNAEGHKLIAKSIFKLFE